jgi:hypothetical protein
MPRARSQGRGAIDPIQQILFKPCIACGGVLRPKGTIDAVTLA